MSTGAASYFTSFGPSSDGRTKPEISGMGTSTAIISTSGVTSTGNGTSYSSPLVCGMLACLLQYTKEKNPAMSLNAFRQVVIENSNLYNAPTTQLGYGITNFQQAMSTVTSFTQTKVSRTNIAVKYIPEHKLIRLNFSGEMYKNTISVSDISGRNIVGLVTESSVLRNSRTNFRTGVTLYTFKILMSSITINC
jgi:hypothetical protein